MKGADMYGWSGTILRVDMTKGTVIKEPLDKKFARDFIGGRGLNSKVLFDEIKPGIDPLSSGNVLCLGVGPLTSTCIAQTSRMEISSLSPYTGILGDGNVGGRLPGYLKHAGYDQIVVTGRSKSPKYLWIDNDVVELRDAFDLWRKTTSETVKRLEEKHGKDIATACIGIGGENLVRFASTIVDRSQSAARGTGAVWGSKKLKAIAVRGTKPVKVADPDNLRKLGKEDREWLSSNEFIHNILGERGTHWFLDFLKETPCRWRYDMSAPRYSANDFARLEVGRKGCYNCVVHCKNWYEVVVGPRKLCRGSGLEITFIEMGMVMGMSSPEFAAVYKNICDETGLCGQALADAVSFSYWLYNNGIINNNDTGGLKLEWSNDEGKYKFMEMIAKREGFGNVVAEGFYNLARIYPGAMKYCYHVKGMNVTSPEKHSDPISMLWALNEATGTRGSDSLRAGPVLLYYGGAHKEWLEKFTEKGAIPGIQGSTVPLLILGQRLCALADMVPRCMTGAWSFGVMIPLLGKNEHPYKGTAEVLSASTGVQFSVADLIKSADRLYNLERAFNVRQGITRRNDIVTMKPSLKESHEGKKVLELHQKLLDEYYKTREWDAKTGIPTRSVLERYNLKYVADELKDNSYSSWEGAPLWSLDKYPKGV